MRAPGALVRRASQHKRMQPTLLRRLAVDCGWAARAPRAQLGWGLSGRRARGISPPEGCAPSRATGVRGSHGRVERRPLRLPSVHVGPARAAGSRTSARQRRHDWRARRPEGAPCMFGGAPRAHNKRCPFDDDKWLGGPRGRRQYCTGFTFGASACHGKLYHASNRTAQSSQWPSG